MACVSPSKEELLASIRPDMKLTWDFFKRIYGYSLYEPEFAERALIALEAVGCSRARDYYKTWVNKYEAEQAAEMKKVAAWYSEECKRQWEKRQKEGERERAKQQQTQWQQSSRERWAEISEALGFQPIAKER